MLTTAPQVHMRAKVEARKLHRLHHPGRIIHLRAIGKGHSLLLLLLSVLSPSHRMGRLSDLKRGCLGLRTPSRVFVPFVTNMKYFSQINISPTMVFDHLPDRYVDQLQELVDEWTLERE
jgi:hypothetical protein